jgi:transposase
LKKMTQHIIGIDVSKDTLDAHRQRDGEEWTFANSRAGFMSLLKWIGPDPVRTVFEPTGPYHRALEGALAKAGHGIIKVNPRQARRFAEATGKLAKTDRLDARILARMGSLLELEPRPVRSELMNDLKDLHIAREALIKDRTAAKNRSKTISLPLLKRQNSLRLAQIVRDIAAVDDAIAAAVKTDAALAERFSILLSIPGISGITAAALVTEMPELGSLDPKQAASLAGVAPMARQSGKWKGRSYVQGGRSNVRQVLYMPALVAMRFNPNLKAKYDQLIAAGKPPKVAITALMRKLIILANALLKANRPWTKKLA